MIMFMYIYIYIYVWIIRSNCKQKLDIKCSLIQLQSNTTPHSEETQHSNEEEFPSRSPPQQYLEESPPHEGSEAYIQQQHELLQRLKEQFTTFPFSNVPNFAGIDLSEHAQRLQPEASHDFPFSFPTPPPSKDENVKISSSTTTNKKSASNQNSWSYEDQFKQVRQVSECCCCCCHTLTSQITI